MAMTWGRRAGKAHFRAAMETACRAAISARDPETEFIEVARRELGELRSIHPATLRSLWQCYFRQYVECERGPHFTGEPGAVIHYRPGLVARRCAYCGVASKFPPAREGVVESLNCPRCGAPL